jgi:hypothetical protein
VVANASVQLRCPATSHTHAGTTYYHNSFEADPTLLYTNEKWVAFSGNNAPYPPAGSWAWGLASNGLAGRLSEYPSPNGLAVDGDFAAFLESDGGTAPSFAFVCGVTASPAMWRISFWAAHTQAATAPDGVSQRIQVAVQPVVGNGGAGGVLVFDEVIRDGIWRQYVSRPFEPMTAALSVEFAGPGPGGNVTLIDLVELRQVQPWSSASTWTPAAVPGSNTPVTIPPGASVGVQSGSADSIMLHGELFALEPPTGGPTPQYTLSTRGLEVHGAGSYFQVGLAALPYQGRFELLLDDDRHTTTANNPTHAPDPESWNGLVAHHHGWIEMHGQPKTSWVRLSETATPGSSTIVLDRFTPPSQTQPDVLDQRAEVGMLSHTVRVRAQPRTAIPAGFGGHIMVASHEIVAGLVLGPPGFGRFSGVELQNLGRAGQLGRYPIHWHMLLGHGQNCYFRNSSIVRSNNRAVAIHGTDSTRFEDNVAFEHIGHGVFLEDGSEQFHVFKNNLIVATRRPAEAVALLPSDREPFEFFQNRPPASFWITNPCNTFLGNVVAHLASDTVAVPNIAALLGVAIGQQAFAIDPTANAAGLVASNAVRFTIGQQ